MKQFQVAMVISAIDKVTAPARGIAASIRKVTGEAEKEGKKSRDRAQKSGRAQAASQKKGIGAMLGESFGKIGSMVPQIAAVTGGVATLVEGYKLVTKASDEAEAAQLRLQNAMMHVKGATQADVDSIADLAGELQKKRPVDDETLKNSAAQLAMFGMTGQQIRKMLPALTDYLVATKGVNATTEDGIASAKLIGKAWAGNTGALRKQGIILTAAQEAIIKHGTAAQKTAIIVRAIQSRMGGIADKTAKTPEGMKKLWEDQLNEVEEKAGAALLPLRLNMLKFANMALPYLSKVADAIPTIFTRGSQIVKAGWSTVFGGIPKGFAGAKTGGLLQSFTSWGPTLTRIFKPIFPIVSSVLGFLYQAVGQIGKWLTNMWQASQPGLKALAEAFKPIIDVVRHLWFRAILPFWNTVLSPFLGWLTGSFVPFLVNILGPAITWLVKQIAGTLNWVIDLFGGIIGWETKLHKTVVGFFTNMWEKMKMGWTIFKTSITLAWHALFGGLFKWIEDKWKGFIDLLRSVGAYFGFGPTQTSSAATGTPLSSAKVEINKSGSFSKNVPLGLAPMQPDLKGLIGPNGGKIDIHVHPPTGHKVSIKDPDGLLLHRGIAGLA